MHQPDHSRFEFREGESLAVCEYHRAGDTLDLHHTYVPDSLRGRGIAAILAKEALDYAKAQGLKVIPSCSPIAPFIGLHLESFAEPEQNDDAIAIYPKNYNNHGS